jgi:microcystin-dependent protein
MEEFIGIIKIFAGNFPPRGWAFCNGQIMSIAQNTALFSILGTTYGGNGQVTFALPDLRGRAPIGTGTGPGLSNFQLGEVGGVENVTLITNQIPAHNHTLNVNDGDATVHKPTTAAVIAAPVDVNGDGVNDYLSTTTTNTTLSPNSIGITGGNLPHENRVPYLGVSYIICLEGIFPSRN